MITGKTKMIGQALMAVLMLCLAGCRQPPSEPIVLNIACQGRPISLVPHGMPELYTVMVQANIYEGLVEFDSGMKVVPLLADHWETPDPKTWIFKLRPGITFHNGKPLRAEDVAFSLRRAKEDTASALRANFVQVASIDVIDSLTLRLTTYRPFPLLLYKLVSVFVVPKDGFLAQGSEAWERAPVGSGPYRLKSNDPQGPLVLSAYPGYWGRRPQFEEIRFLESNELSEISRLLGDPGSPTIVPHLDQAAARSLEAVSRKKYSIQHRPGLVLRYLALRWDRKPFQDLRVRRAISLAIDRQSLVGELCYGYATPANQPVPITVFGYNDRLAPLAYDPASASELLKQAGYHQGLDLTLLLPSQREAIGRILAEQMKPAGIRLHLKLVNRDDFFRSLDTAAFFYIGYSSNSGDASDLLDEALHSKVGGYGVNNYGGYSNREVDRLTEISDTCFSQERRLKLIQAAMKLIYDDMAIIPLFIEDQISACSDNIQWRPRLDMLVLGKEIGLKHRRYGSK